MKRIISMAVICLAAVLAAEAESFEQIKSAAQPGYSDLPQGAFIEGIIVSDYRSLNMGENPQVAWNKVDSRVTYCTAYIQNEEGTSGFRLMFNELYDNRFPRCVWISPDVSSIMRRNLKDIPYPGSPRHQCSFFRRMFPQEEP